MSRVYHALGAALLVLLMAVPAFGAEDLLKTSDGRVLCFGAKQ